MANGKQSFHHTTVDGLDIFYREAGSPQKPVIVLLHGFPASSHMFRDLIPQLAPHFHVIAPDYPGFGYSSAPPADQFSYTFDHLAQITGKLLDQLNINEYAIYIQDYGAPVGLRLATAHPERIKAIVTQNGNAFEEGLGTFWDEYIKPFWANRNEGTERKARELLTLEATKLQYLDGVQQVEHISPDAWTFDQQLLDRPVSAAIQLDLFYDYRNNLPHYPAWQQYLRTSDVPVLAVWGKNDQIFVAAGAKAFQQNNAKTELHLLDTGHFALEEESDAIAQLMIGFLQKHLAQTTSVGVSA